MELDKLRAIETLRQEYHSQLEHERQQASGLRMQSSELLDR